MTEIYIDKNSKLSGAMLSLEIVASFLACAFLYVHFGSEEYKYLFVIIYVGIVYLITRLHKHFFPTRLELYMKIYDEYMEVYQEEVTTIQFAHIYNIDYIEKTEYSREDGEREIIVGIDVSWKGEKSGGAIVLDRSAFIGVDNGVEERISIEELMFIIRQHIHNSSKKCL